MSGFDDMFNKMIDEAVESIGEEVVKETPTTEYKKGYWAEITKPLYNKVKTTLLKKSQFLMVSGPVGSGKSETIHRVCKANNIEIFEYDSSMDLSEKLDELKTLMKSVKPIEKYSTKTPPKFIFLFEDLDDQDIPDWFYSKRDQSKNSFLDFAKQYYMRFNFNIIITVRDKYNVPYELRNKYCDVFDQSLLHMGTVKKIVRENTDIQLPNGYPKDLHQIHLYVMYNGYHTPYVEKEDHWTVVRKYFAGEYKHLPGADETKRPISEWWLVNLLNKPFFARRNTNEFFYHLALLCLADRWGDKLLLGNIPIEAMEWRNTQELAYPTYVWVS